MIFYCSYSPEYYKGLNLSEESIIIFEHEVVQVLVDFLRHLLVVQTTIFKVIFIDNLT